MMSRHPPHPGDGPAEASLADRRGCADLIFGRDWSATLLGSSEGWPPALRETVGMILRSPVPMLLLWGREGVILYNDAHAAVLGTLHPATLGRTVAEAWPDHVAYHDEVIAACLRGGTRSYKNLELPLDRPGRPPTGFFDLDYWPVPDATGRPAGVLCSVVETTEAILATRALRAAEERARAKAERWRDAEERLRQVLVGARAGTWEARLTDAATDFGFSEVRWDEAYRAVYGFSADVEPSSGAWRRLVHPDDLARVDGNVRAALEGGTSEWVQEFRIQHPSLGLRWIHDRVRLRRDADGRPVSLGGLNFDITERRQAEDERDRARILLETFVQAVPGVVFAKDVEGRHLIGNRGFYEAVGKAAQDCVGRTEEEFLGDPAEARAIQDADRRIMAAGVLRQVEERVSQGDGTPAWWLSTKAPLRDADGQVVGLVGASVDITARKEAEAALAESEARFRNVADHSPVMMWMTDAEGACTYLNRLWYEFTGQGEAEALGDGWLRAIHPADRPEAERVFLDANARRTSLRVRYRLRRADGAWRWTVDAAIPRWNPDGSFLGFIGSVVDITDHVEAQEAVERARSAAEHAARHDALTGLPSRGHLRERLAAQLAADGAGTATALLFVDLDGFKAVNDALGHQAGDALLVEAGRRLGSCLGPDDFLARMGGDEFVILCPAARGRGGPEALAQRLLGRLAEPFGIDGSSIAVGGSIGIAIPEGPGTGPDDLIRQADIALYRAKAEGRGMVRVFERGLEEAALARQRLGADLRDAAGRGEFVLHFQPIVELGTLCPRGHEALLRWARPGQDLLAPGAFIDMAESSGVIERIGAWAMGEACRAAAAWPGDLVVSVNLSPRQFRSGDLVGTVSRALRETGLPGRRLMVEITESVLLQDDEGVCRTLSGLRDLGVRVAIDDFGTGFSSLGYLRKFTVDVIKIDRSFVADLADNPRSRAILRAVMSLACDLGLSVTAEGVETPEQLELLRGIGCHFGQGFLFGPPVPAVPAE